VAEVKVEGAWQRFFSAVAVLHVLSAFIYFKLV